MKASRSKANGQKQAKRHNAAGNRVRRLGLQKTKGPFIPTRVLQQLAGTELPRNEKKIIKIEEQLAALMRQVKDLEGERRRVLAVTYNQRLRELLNTVPSPRRKPRGDGHSGGRAGESPAAAAGSLSER